MTRRRRCTLIAALSLATAAGAGAPSGLAASAGDIQYQDPFVAQNQDDTGDSSSGSSGSGASPMSGGEPLTAAPPSESDSATAASQDSSGESSSSSSSSSGSGQLPATGAHIALVALAGAGMLLAGIGLRLREPGA